MDDDPDQKYVLVVNQNGVLQSNNKITQSKRPIIKVEVTTEEEKGMFVEIPLGEQEEDEQENLRASKLRRKQVNFDAILDLITKPARIIHNRTKNRYILRCVRMDGKTRERYFMTLSALEKFVEDVPEIRDWLMVEQGDILSQEALQAARMQRDKKWKFRQSVEAGNATIQFVDSLFEFNITKKYIMHQRWKPYVKVSRDPKVPVKSVHTSSWGETHRMDDIYELINNPPDTVVKSRYPVCVWTVGCSSKSDKCTSACGVLLSECSVIDGKFSCCNQPVPVSRTCYNCSSTTSAYGSWHRLEGKIACKICFNYYRRRRRDRPFTPEQANKSYFGHFKCNFQLKLELQADFKTYFVYDLKSNSAEHYTANGVGTRRFKQSERDAVDILRTARFNPFQILKRNQSHLEGNKKLRLRQYQNRCRRISKKIDKMEVIETSIVSEPENLQTAQSDANGVDVDYAQSQSSTKDNTIEVLDEAIEATNTVTTTVISTTTEDVKNSIACLKCVFEQRDEVYSCMDESNLVEHILTCHNENIMCCVNCLENGVVHSFATAIELRKHVEESHTEAEVETNTENVMFEEATS